MNDHDAEFTEKAETRRRDRMTRIDSMSPQFRNLVHIYGFNVVTAFMENGLTRAKSVVHLIETVLNELSPTRGTFSKQGLRGEKREGHFAIPPKALEAAINAYTNTVDIGRSHEDAIRAAVAAGLRNTLT